MRYGRLYGYKNSFDDSFRSNMVNNTYIQFKHENDTWLRTLDYFQQENIYLKNRIAQIAKTNINSIFLNALEAYQTRFVDKDAVISILRYDIMLQNDLIEDNKSGETPALNNRIIQNQNKLREDMVRMEREFNRLKFDFNNYLSEAFQ